jgi:hypothetical protein
MLTIKKNQTVKAIKGIKIGEVIVEVGTILTIHKGGKEPVFLTRINGEEFAFSVGKNADKCFVDAVCDSKVEKEISNVSFKKFKAIQSMDGFAMSADIHINGKKIAKIENGGYGGPTEIEVYDLKNQAVLDKLVEQLKNIRGEKIYQYEDDAGIVEEFMNYLMSREDLFISFKEKMEERRKDWEDLNKKMEK